MKTIKLFTAVVIAIGLFPEAKAQNGNSDVMSPTIKVMPPAPNTLYITEIGIRAGETSGLTLKQFIGQTTALEGIIGMSNDGLSLTGLYERYAPSGAPGLNWYYGVGAHIAFETGPSYDTRYGYYDYDYINAGVGLGVDIIFGIEYKIPPIPVALSLDVKPLAEINTNGGVYVALDPGIGIKIIF